MTVQLKYLLIEQFEWLLHVVQYASDELRTNALSTVRYAEFCLPTCHYGSNEVIHIGKNLAPFLSTYDFPWTSIRPDYEEGYSYALLLSRWLKSLQTRESIVRPDYVEKFYDFLPSRRPKYLQTSESIAQHVAVFEQDLCQLVEKLKEFVFLDIHGEIDYKKVEAYRSMVQVRFPHSRIDIETSRFRLWL
ncbi:unnamed protein product [Rotaria sordida]|uniref:Uncharacterized protein n=2 Tax=Rotaria sordida TaxID=392033 RepID=A0A815PQZ4_9BILA|nr:unnamed protein product [Rotaria sordida]